MKNLNQAGVNANKRRGAVPSEKLQSPTSCDGAIKCAPSLSAMEDPLQGINSFEVILDWIGDTMEPEVFVAYWATVRRRKDMYPCVGELVIGLLTTGDLVFGAHETESPGLCRIAFINPKYAPVYYAEKDFRWLYPVDSISVMSDTVPRYRKLIKKLEFFQGGE